MVIRFILSTLYHVNYIVDCNKNGAYQVNKYIAVVGSEQKIMEVGDVSNSMILGNDSTEKEDV